MLTFVVCQNDHPQSVHSSLEKAIRWMRLYWGTPHLLIEDDLTEPNQEAFFKTDGGHTLDWSIATFTLDEVRQNSN